MVLFLVRSYPYWLGIISCVFSALRVSKPVKVWGELSFADQVPKKINLRERLFIFTHGFSQGDQLHVFQPGQAECHGKKPIMEIVAHLMVSRKWETGTDSL